MRRRAQKLEARGSKLERRAFPGLVTGPRIRLRPLAERDLPAVETWIGRPLGRSRVPAAKLRELQQQAAGDPSRRVLAVLEGSGPPVGVAAFRAPWPAEGWLTFGLVVLAREQRGRGLALEAVTAVEEEARRRGLAGSFAAPVSAEFGRALYFWLRLGYRPVLRSRLPWPDPGGADLWLVRDGP